VLALALSAAAGAQTQGAGPWDGSNPFACTLQQVGTGTDFPDPDADPFCVEFEKRHQNVTELGIVDFLSKEPARVAAAGPKCFYFQRDHWRSSLVQDDARTVLYEWDGSYFFDKARGRGGVYVENFKIAGQTGDPRLVPGFPEEWKPYFGPGRGGVQVSGEVQAEPSCGNRPAPGTPAGPPAGSAPSCRAPGGLVTSGIGGVRLRMTRRSAKRALGAPSTESLRYASWCLDGGGRLVAAFGGRGDRSRVRLVLTDSPPFDARGIRAGTPARGARRRLRGERTLGRVGAVAVLAVRERGRELLIGVGRSRVAWIGVADSKLTRRAIAKLIARSPRVGN
jgi:hypothetical protein